jgi:hypothetical protein
MAQDAVLDLGRGRVVFGQTFSSHQRLVEEMRAEETGRREASLAVDIPVTGLDFLVAELVGPDHVFSEANEHPGLADHEPLPTAQRLIDLLFPESRRR